MSTPDAGRLAGMRLCPLHWHDLAELARAETDLFAEDAWSEQTWWAELAARPRRDYVVARAASGDLAGYAGLDHGGPTADVMTVAVLAAYRGLGLGDLLVEWLVDTARARGAEALLLEVRADNPAALALYQRHGFAELSVRARYYQPGDVDAIVLRRLLKQEGAGHG
ncbi:MAG: ribosomal-protein-alanine N-acetyltransferase [Actinomycetales bacterium]|nr:MAG: ribosomal-protein-alanine N-acetyltransferase [Actinomycetales bacterium]